MVSASHVSLCVTSGLSGRSRSMAAGGPRQKHGTTSHPRRWPWWGRPSASSSSRFVRPSSGYAGFTAEPEIQAQTRAAASTIAVS